MQASTAWRGQSRIGTKRRKKGSAIMPETP